MSDTITKRQDKNKEGVLEKLKMVPIIEVACKQVGIARSTFYRWKEEDKNFAEQVEKALEEGQSNISGLAESKLISAIKDQNMTGIIFWLKHHHKDYATKVELSGKIKTESDNLTPEQEELIKKAIQLASIQGKDYGKTNTTTDKPNNPGQ
ncbi:phBC6A51 family helix-turn-helix protein [Patescibacteria group bacterium]